VSIEPALRVDAIVVETHGLDQLVLRLGEIAGAVKVAISMVARTLKVTVTITSSCTIASIDIASLQKRSILLGGPPSTSDQYATTYS
jgi:branched-subunit amino acid transport protein